MVQALLMKKVFSYVLKELQPMIAPLQKYVNEKNELDIKCEELEKRMSLLEKMAHPKREFVMCNECNQRIKEKK